MCKVILVSKIDIEAENLSAKQSKNILTKCYTYSTIHIADGGQKCV